jgi:hypothetical protein
MPKFEGRKLDLLPECNERREPPREFMAIFCNHCRNPACVNAGYASSKFEERIAMQVSRLITNPAFADPNDPTFRELRKMEFVTRDVPIELNRDPWAGPGVHLAEQDRNVQTNEMVENAVAALAAASGKKYPPRAIEAEGMKSDEDAPKPSPLPPQASPRPATETAPTGQQEPPRPSPRHYLIDRPGTLPGKEMMNTPFPAEGVMLDGSPPPAPGSESPAEDPWSTSGTPVAKKVAVGAKVKMGGGSKP